MMAGKKADQITSGQHIIVVGLLIQIIFFGIFILTTAMFHMRIHKAPTLKSADPYVSWTKHMRVLYATSILMMIRSVIRVIEYVQGNDGYILRHEEFIYIFDACLMLAVLRMYNVVHPSEITRLINRRIKASDREVALEMK